MEGWDDSDSGRSEYGQDNIGSQDGSPAVSEDDEELIGMQPSKIAKILKSEVSASSVISQQDGITHSRCQRPQWVTKDKTHKVANTSRPNEKFGNVQNHKADGNLVKHKATSRSISSGSARSKHGASSSGGEGPPDTPYITDDSEELPVSNLSADETDPVIEAEELFTTDKHVRYVKRRTHEIFVCFSTSTYTSVCEHI